MKFVVQMMTWLSEHQYTHCFFVAGGNSMHALDAARQSMECIPFVHEMSATIAAEYFNESQQDRRAFVLLTAGPGLTHAISGIAGAYLENRSLLVIGGQVKTTDLSRGKVRQRGIQEVAGSAIARPVCKASVTATAPLSRADFMALINQQWQGKPGPVFLELPLDVQATEVLA